MKGRGGSLKNLVAAAKKSTETKVNFGEASVLDASETSSPVGVSVRDECVGVTVVSPEGSTPGKSPLNREGTRRRSTLRRSQTKRLTGSFTFAKWLKLNESIITKVEAVKDEVFPARYFSDMIEVLETQLILRKESGAAMLLSA